MENLPKITFNTNKNIKDIPTQLDVKNIQLLKIERMPRYGGLNKAHVRIKIDLETISLEYDFCIDEPSPASTQELILTSSHSLMHLDLLHHWFKKYPDTEKAVINFATTALKAEQILHELSKENNLTGGSFLETTETKTITYNKN